MQNISVLKLAIHQSWVVIIKPEVEKYVIFSVSQQKWNNGYLKGQFQLQCKNKSG